MTSDHHRGMKVCPFIARLCANLIDKRLRTGRGFCRNLAQWPVEAYLSASVSLISNSALHTAANPNVETKARVSSKSAIQPNASCSIIRRMPPTSVATNAPTEIRPANAPAKKDCVKKTTTDISSERPKSRDGFRRQPPIAEVFLLTQVGKTSVVKTIYQKIKLSPASVFSLGGEAKQSLSGSKPR